METSSISIAYGMGPNKLYDKLNGEGFPIEYDGEGGATTLYKTYCEEFKTGVNFLRDSGKLAVQQGYLANLNGRRRNWIVPVKPEYDPESDVEYQEWKKRVGGIEREGGNFLIQSVNADITKLAMTRIRKYCKQNKIRSTVLLQVYDEIVTCTHKDDSEEFRKAKTKIMAESAERFVSSVPIEIDGHALPYWTK